MLSRLEPLIKAVTRRVETPDAKMGIRRDESEIHERNKKDEAAQSAQSLPWDDTTEVSIDALYGFLYGLLYGVAPPQQGANVAIHPPQHDAAPQTAQTQIASRAARAYQTTGRMVHDRNMATEIVATEAAPTSTVTSDFSEEEQQLITGYLADLQELKRRGREMLVLQRNLTFFESIRLAISEEMARAS